MATTKGRRGASTSITALLLGLIALTPAAAPAISGVGGEVHYYNGGAVVPDVTVDLVGPGQMSTTTDDGGAFVFGDPGAGDWQVEPHKLGGAGSGVSTLDASFALQAVVGLRTFSDHQRLACDVTGDGRVSSLDAARILQLVAGMSAQLPAAEACGSDWIFVPDPAAAPNQRLVTPQMAPMCQPGAIAYEPLTAPVESQNFVAILLGDCTGNWQPQGAPTATPTEIPPSATATPVPPTPTATDTATRTATASATPTATVPPPPNATITVTSTPTRTGTRTQTPTPTATQTPTYTATCISGLGWNVTAPVLVSSQAGGDVWLSRTVPTDTGWGVFWLRNDPGASTTVRLYYAHVDFDGGITVAPMLLASIPKIAFRGHYYMVTWNAGHYALLTAEQGSLYYQTVSLGGAISQRHVVGPPLFIDPNYDQEADGDVYPYPGGFMGVVEGECAGHSCAYAFKLDNNGQATSAVVNLVDFDLTHQFYPSAAFDGSGFAILSVKDIQIATGGVMTKYWSSSGIMSSHVKVVKSKEYQWDEFPDIAYNGNHFAALWTENSARSHTSPWQIHFATFHRNANSGSDIAHRVIDMVSQKTNHRWTTQVHPMGGDWVAQYASRAANGSVVAVFELLGDDAETGIYLEPFPLTADALGSSRHTAPGVAGVLGIARGSNVANGTTVEFYKLAPPSCQ